MVSFSVLEVFALRTRLSSRRSDALVSRPPPPPVVARSASDVKRTLVTDDRLHIQPGAARYDCHWWAEPEAADWRDVFGPSKSFFSPFGGRIIHGFVRERLRWLGHFACAPPHPPSQNIPSHRRSSGP